MAELSLSTKVKLNNGVEMPILGLGTWLSKPGSEAYDAVRWALDAGYRHIDTAKAYKNEADVGRAIRESGVPREEIFVTTKLWNSDHGYESALGAFRKSLDTLGLPYINLYLIHWPGEGQRRESWEALETLVKEKTCRAIGVSNFTVAHLEELLKTAKVVPAVNQVEFSPFLHQKELFEFCRARGIQLESYSPLTRGARFKNRVVAKLAEKYGKTPAQVLIRWELEHGIVTIPKSVHKARIVENAAVFDFSLAPEDMDILDNLNEDLRKCWDPTNVI